MAKGERGRETEQRANEQKRGLSKGTLLWRFASVYAATRRGASGCGAEAASRGCFGETAGCPSNRYEGWKEGEEGGVSSGYRGVEVSSWRCRQRKVVHQHLTANGRICSSQGSQARNGLYGIVVLCTSLRSTHGTRSAPRIEYLILLFEARPCLVLLCPSPVQMDLPTT